MLSRKEFEELKANIAGDTKAGVEPGYYNECIALIESLEQLEKEADWLASRVMWCGGTTYESFCPDGMRCTRSSDEEGIKRCIKCIRDDAKRDVARGNSRCFMSF